MTKSYRCRDYQWAEIAANTAEINGAEVVSIHPENDDSTVERFGLCLRVWVRWPANVPDKDPVLERLLGHYA